MSALDRAAKLMARGGIVAFTGAGMSAEAGIPTFRDPGGVWDRFDPDRFGSWRGLEEMALQSPDELAGFLAELRRVFARARPTPGHHALARMQEAGLLRSVVTQNVDGLHQEAGSRDVVEIHGSFSRLVGILCDHRESISRERFVALLDRAIAGLRSAFVPSLGAILPRCGECGKPMRPDFVAFGEVPHDLARAERMMGEAGVLLVVGTSGEVYPAATLPALAREAGASIVEVGRDDTSVASDVRVRGHAGKVLPALAERILS